MCHAQAAKYPPHLYSRPGARALIKGYLDSCHEGEASEAYPDRTKFHEREAFVLAWKASLCDLTRWNGTQSSKIYEEYTDFGSIAVIFKEE
jgi:hypothetical protein